MENMICFDCVLKHLAGALSYGKQIISGHGKGADLDHRIDYLGEITNAEHHLQLIDDNLFNQISTYRKQLQSKKVEINQADLEFIRRMYISVELRQDGTQIKQGNYHIAENSVDVVYLEVTNADYFKFSYDSVKKYLQNYNKIYVLKSSIDLSSYANVQIVNLDLKQFALLESTADDFIVMYENTGFLRETDGKKIIPTYSLKNRNIKIIQQMNDLGINKTIYNYENIKAQPINKAEFNKIVSSYDGQNYLSLYALRDGANLALDTQFTVEVDRPVCCSTKNNLKTKHYVRWNEKGFQSLKQFLS